MTILLTGFVAYRDHETNPSELLALRFDGTVAAGHDVVGRVLPVGHQRTAQQLETALTDVQPDAVLMLGLFPSRPQLTIERVAVNILDYPFPDNDGEQPVDLPVVADGPAAYLTSFDVREVVRGWEAAGIPGSVSYTAGTYVCNESYYRALHATAGRGIPVAFIHVPRLEAAGNPPETPGMSLDAMAEAVAIALDSVARAVTRSPEAAAPAAVQHRL